MPTLSKFFLASLPFILGATTALAQTNCAAGTSCGSSAPCCSEFGFCGTDHCLGGCNPLWSHSLDSCLPTPICVDKTYTFADNSRILSNITQYTGNSSAWDWTVDKGNVYNTGGELALILTKDNGGTRISSTKYVHYGTITATMKTGRWDGVVTAFITMSDVKDEIDWEWPGSKTTQGQSNYFWLGVIPDATHGGTHDVSSDTYSNYHDYTIDWQPDQLQFLIDGKVVRTVTKASTMSNGAAQYPSTPSRVEISIWPAGIAGSPDGTVKWAGGMINWEDPDYVAAGGHFAATVKSVSVKCTKETGTNAQVKNATSYVYTGNTTEGIPGVSVSNASTSAAGESRIVAVRSSLLVAGAMAISVALGMTALA